MSAFFRPIVSLSYLQKRVVWHLRAFGATPRALLADALGQSGATMTRVTQELTALGLIEEDDPLASVRGRPMVPVRVASLGAYAAGAFCHPGWLEVMLVDFAGHVLGKAMSPFTSADPRDFARAVDDHLRQLSSQLGVTQRRFLGLGISVPGYIVGQKGHRSVVSWLSGWSDVPLDEFFHDALGMPVVIENDGASAALAEYYQPEVIKRFKSVLVFCLGHGVGGGLICERDLYRGEFGNAAEIGRLFPADQPRPSGIDLLATLRGHGIEIEDLLTVSDALEAHVTLIEQWADRAAGQLRIAIESGVAWIDPGAIVIAGSLPPPLLQGLATRLATWERAPYRGAQPFITGSKLGSSAICLGAALMPIHLVSRF